MSCATASPAPYTIYFTRNAYGATLTVTDPLGHQSVLTYDVDQNLKTSKDPDNNQTTYVYDPAEQRTQITRPDTTTLKTDYWPDGTLKSQTDGANQTTSYAYDASAHLTTVTDPPPGDQHSYTAVGDMLANRTLVGTAPRPLRRGARRTATTPRTS